AESRDRRLLHRAGVRRQRQADDCLEPRRARRFEPDVEGEAEPEGMPRPAQGAAHPCDCRRRRALERGRVRWGAVLLLALFLAGCGAGEGGHGTATLWVTRDHGGQVLYTGTVPAGLTAMQALERKLKVSTRYGGRFVQSIDGVSGSASGQRDWF